MECLAPARLNWGISADQISDRARRMHAPEAPSDTEVRVAIEMLRSTLPETLDAGVYAKMCTAFATLYRGGHLETLAPLLPLWLRLKGKPYTLKNHLPMEALFKCRPAKRNTAKTGRQVAKSTSSAANICIQSSIQPYFRTLYIAPRFDQTRRFSTECVRPFLQESPLGRDVITSGMTQSVLQRDFPNKATSYYSYAFLDCDRIRGYSADCVRYDEAQDLDPDFIPVIHEVLSASEEFGMEYFTGTPKTLDNLLETNWESSTMSEWCIKCQGCGHWNIPTAAHDALKMIHPKGLVCAHCEHLLDSMADGELIHSYSDRLQTHLGIHVPQIVLPMHYRPHPTTGSMEKWAEICRAKEGEISVDKFYNEKLGEAYDLRAGLLTRTDLVRASSLPWENKFNVGIKKCGGYTKVILGVDWGGGGQDGLSMTSVSVLGGKPDLSVDVIYTEKLFNAMSDADTIRIVKHYFKEFKCSQLAHDYAGAGQKWESMLVSSGFDPRLLFPCYYLGTTAGTSLITYQPPSDKLARGYFQIDKARSLAMLCMMVKGEAVRFPKFDSWQALSKDFLAMVEDKHESRGADVYLITRKANLSDDTVHSVNFAASAYWYTQRRWPDVSKKLGLGLTPAQAEELKPSAHNYGK